MAPHKRKQDNAAAHFIAESLNPNEFLNTFSYREVLTAIALSFCCVASMAIIQYYRDERFVQHWYRTIVFTVAILAFLINHVFYRFEHGRSNSLMGRAMLDIVFLICFYLIKSIYLSIIQQSNQFSFDADDVLDVFGIIVGVLLMVFLFEFLVSLLKHLLKLVRCPVL